MGTANKTLNYTNLQGSQIGRYRLENLLGIGGMGNVYKSHHPDLKRDIAVKILHPHFTHTPGFIERFRHEAAAAGSLVHPRIIQVYDFNVTDGGLYYMVMQFINGPSLEEYLALEQGPLSLAHSYRILAPVAAALHFAHEQGVIHRDIKPANILLDTRQNPFLGDFGLAKIVGVDLQTAAEFGPGTPAYMAPEQIEKGELSRATDIYGLGLVLYKMLTLRLPFEGDSLLQLIRRKSTEPARSPADFNPQLPPEVVSVIRRAIAIDPDTRYPDAVSFIEAYQEAVQRQGVAVPRFDPDTAISSGFVSLPGIYIEGYKIQREIIEPRNRPYQRYLAKNETLDELAVLTVLKTTHEENPILARLFQERLDKLVLLDHPGIFAITRVDVTVDEHPFCAYAYIAGQNLATLLAGPWQQAEGALPASAALLLCRQMADSLLVAAQVNIWHHDLHPAHVIIPANRVPVLVGWEIPLPPPFTENAFTENGRSNRSSADEPGYLAPEQLAGDGVTPQSYQFCLGVMIHELLTGQGPPLPGWRTRPYTPADIPVVHLLSSPDTPVTPETQHLLSRCLASNPADRFPDMASFMAQLDRAILAEQNRPPSLPRLSRQAEPTMAVGHTRRWTPLLVLLLVLLGLFIVWGLYGQWSAASSPGITPTATATVNNVLATPTSAEQLLLTTAVGPLPTSPGGEVIPILGPAPGSQFTLDAPITFAWRWPHPLAANEQFAVYLLGGESPILLGVVAEPSAPEDEGQYQLVGQGETFLAAPATYVWQVQLVTAEATGSPLASSSVSLITFVSPTATPSRTPTSPPLNTRRPLPTPTERATTTPTYTVIPTATRRSCPPPAGWVSYQVQAGDTVAGLALLTGSTASEIYRANCLETGSDLTVGQTIWLPQRPATATATSAAPVPTTAPPDPTATSLPVIPSPTPLPPEPTFTPPSLPTFTPPPNPGGATIP